MCSLTGSLWKRENYISYSFYKSCPVFGLVIMHINHCRLFNAKSSLYIYILNIYDLVWLVFMAYQPL